ncbi:MAG: hypothetical protein EOO69_04465 [Moraxellaceae bacterium]|nr:MAG: hypothetical protein EOO69_04465 [Moraxellaceae bacterium]
MNSFSHKKIEIELRLTNTTTFAGQGDNNTLTFRNLRIVADIQLVGSLSEGSKARVKIYGMRQEDMNALSMLTWKSQTVYKNVMIVRAGDDDGMSKIFGGQILNAWADYSATPEVCMVIDAKPGYFERIQEANASSYPGDVDVAIIMADLASKMGYQFENRGVNLKLSTPYFSGTLMCQAETLARQADINVLVEDDRIVITPKNMPIEDGQIPLISAASGMVGYPAFYKNGISVKTLFNPAIRFMHKIKVQSDIPIANGEWFVYCLRYQLESEKPNGAWFCEVDAGLFGLGSNV